jgi:electron transport complex protein RnfA
VSSQIGASVGMGAAVIFVMTLASSVTWILQSYVLTPFHIGFLQTITFILVIASLVQFIEMVINKISPALKKSLGIYLPLITTNCAVLGVAILNIRSDLNFLESSFNGFGAGIGFTLALLIMAGIRERLDMAPVPKALKGVPITFLVASLLFAGLITE